MTYEQTLISELATHGVTDWWIDRDHPHPQLHFVWQSRPLMYVMSSTPSDRRAHLNAVSDLRRLMGVRRVVHKSERPKRQKSRAIRIPALGSFTVRANPMNVLAPMNAAMEAGRFAFFAGASDVPLPGYAPSAFRAGWWDGHRGYFA